MPHRLFPSSHWRFVSQPDHKPHAKTLLRQILSNAHPTKRHGFSSCVQGFAVAKVPPKGSTNVCPGDVRLCTTSIIDKTPFSWSSTSWCRSKSSSLVIINFSSARISMIWFIHLVQYGNAVGTFPSHFQFNWMRTSFGLHLIYKKQKASPGTLVNCDFRPAGIHGHWRYQEHTYNKTESITSQKRYIIYTWSDSEANEAVPPAIRLFQKFSSTAVWIATLLRVCGHTLQAVSSHSEASAWPSFQQQQWCQVWVFGVSSKHDVELRIGEQEIPRHRRCHNVLKLMF